MFHKYGYYVFYFVKKLKMLSFFLRADVLLEEINKCTHIICSPWVTRFAPCLAASSERSPEPAPRSKTVAPAPPLGESAPRVSSSAPGLFQWRFVCLPIEYNTKLSGNNGRSKLKKIH